MMRIALGRYYWAICEFDNVGPRLYCGRYDDLWWVTCFIFCHMSREGMHRFEGTVVVAWVFYVLGEIDVCIVFPFQLFCKHLKKLATSILM